MKINERMKIRQVVGENVVIMPGVESTDMTRVVALNESAMLLYNALAGREFEVADVYEVDEDAARKDAEAWVADMKKNHLIV